MRYVCISLVLSATDRAKASRELTQHVHETTAEVSKQDPGETSVDRSNGDFPWISAGRNPLKQTHGRI